MSEISFDPDNTLAGALFAMTPRETVTLGVRLCEAVERAVGADGCHGGVWPGNVTWAEGKLALGPVNRLGIADMSPEALEFVSPEQFWSGGSSPASDVYSIGLMLYTALNRGVMPYFKKAEDNTPEERAEALQSRMKGERLPYPASAARSLGDVVLKAVSFRAEDRYPSPGVLRAALEALPDGAEVPAAVPPVSLTERERQRVPSYRVDKAFEPTDPPARSHGRKSVRRGGNLRRLGLEDDNTKTEQVLRTLVTGHNDAPAAPAPEQSAPTAPPAPSVSADVVPEPPEPPAAKAAEPVSEPPAVEPTPKPEPTPRPAPPVPPEPEPPKKKPKPLPGEVDEDMDAEAFRSGEDPKKRKPNLVFPILLAAVVVIAVIFIFRSCHRDTLLPESAAPTPTPAATESAAADQLRPPVETAPAPAETDAPAEETPAPLGPRYGVVTGDFGWEEAKALAEQAGGHLAVLRNGIDLQEAINLAEQSGVRYLWLGAYRSPDTGNWTYVTGETLDFADWDVGQPRNADGEDYMLLRYRAALGAWSCAGAVNDPAAVLPDTYAGHIGYLVEYEQ